MEIFLLVLQQMLMMFTLILAGVLLKKKNIVPADTGVSLAKLETYLIVPALNFKTQLLNCNVDNFLKSTKLILYGGLIMIPAVLLAYLICYIIVPKKNEDKARKYQRNIYKYAAAFGNYGFVGNFIVLGIWGDMMFYKYTMFTFIINIVCVSWGLYILIPKDDNSQNKFANLKKGLLAPPIIALVLGMICGLLNIKQYFPKFLISSLENASACMGPIAMILAGIVIGEYNFKELLKNKKVYIITFLRLIVIPFVFTSVLKLAGASNEVIIFTLIAFATPLGLNTIVYPSAYGGDTKTGASMAMISQVFSIITIPVMYYIFCVM